MTAHPDASRPDVVRKSQFAIVPMWVHRRIIATRTRTMALSVYVELVGQYAGNARDAEGLRVWPEVQQIADSMEVPKSSVERALKVLIDCGVVLKKRTVRRNQYWLPQEDPEAFTQTLAEFQSVTSDGPHPQSVTSDGPETVTSDGPQSVTSDGLCKPDPSIQTQEISLSSVVGQAEGARGRATAAEERETLASPTDKPTTTLPAQRAEEPRQHPQEPAQTTATTAERVVRQAALVQPAEEPAFIAWATARHQPRTPAWWRTVAKQGDLPELVAAWRSEAVQGASQPAVPVVLPPWCGQCDGEEVPRRWREDDAGRTYRCPACHPDTAPAPAATAVSRQQQEVDDWADRSMARALARRAAREQQTASQPLPGDTRCAGWSTLADQLRAAEQNGGGTSW